MTNITGSRWWKFDFHTHTPFSTDTAWAPLIGSDDELSPETWLQKYMEAETDCVAVTDHNGGGWIDRLKSEYEKLADTRPDWFRKLTLFPGVEISVNGGFHLLGIFDPLETTSKIDSLLGAVGFHGKKGNPQQRTEQSCEQVAKMIVAHGGICIPAHVDISNGIFYTNGDGKLRDSQSIRQLLKMGLIEAVEVRDPNWAEPGLYRDLNLALPHLLATDCHNFRGERKPGEYFTWIKMGKPSLEGLRLALVDGNPLSVLRSDQTTDNPNRTPATVIESVRIGETVVMGRGLALEAPFSPWLTSVIGGRGSGKSTILDCLRLVFDRVGDLPPELADEYELFSRVAPADGQRGIMRADSEIVAVVCRETGRFRLTWRYDTKGVRIERQNDDGDWEPTDGLARQRFPVRLMSQKEIYVVASQPQYLIELVDSSPELKLNDWREKNKQLESKYRRLRSEQRELKVSIEPKKRLEGELAEIKAGIDLFEAGDNRNILQAFQATRRQQLVLDERSEEVDSLVLEIKELQESSSPSDVNVTVFSDEETSDQDAVALLRESHAKQKAIEASLKSLANDLTEFNLKWRERLTASSWQVKKTQVDQSYSKLTETLREAGVKDPSGYSTLIQRRQLIAKQLTTIAAAEKRVSELEADWRSVIKEFSEHQCDRAQRRQQFLEDVLADNEYVQATVRPFGVRSKDCEANYREIVSCFTKFERDILEDDRGILAKLYVDLPDDPDARMSELMSRTNKIKSDTAAMAISGNAVVECSQRFSKKLQKLAPEELDGIWLWFPDDILEVSYRRDPRRDVWSPIEQGSPGQKTAAILAFLLSHGEEPIILDQPEDDLDNHLIYDLVVQQVRESKRRRQIIIATHNPNIVVNGDAEMVLAMDVHRERCVIQESKSGCLQESEVREEVCKVMEGGRDAFLKRYQRMITPNNR